MQKEGVSGLTTMMGNITAAENLTYFCMMKHDKINAFSISEIKRQAFFIQSYNDKMIINANGIVKNIPRSP